MNAHDADKLPCDPVIWILDRKFAVLWRKHHKGRKVIARAAWAALCGVVIVLGVMPNVGFAFSANKNYEAEICHLWLAKSVGITKPTNDALIVSFKESVHRVQAGDYSRVKGGAIFCFIVIGGLLTVLWLYQAQR